MNAYQLAPTSLEERANCSTMSPTRGPSMWPRPTLGASMRPGLMRTSMRPATRVSMMSPSMRPTLVPSSRATGSPRSFVPEPPATQRSASIHPRFEAVARQEAKHLVAIMRQSVQVLRELVDDGSTVAVDAMDDIHRTLDRLEHRIGSWSQPQSR